MIAVIQFFTWNGRAVYAEEATEGSVPVARFLQGVFRQRMYGKLAHFKSEDLPWPSPTPHIVIIGFRPLPRRMSAIETPIHTRRRSPKNILHR
jgi:hypothetical protein